MLQGNIILTGGSGFLGRGIIRRAMREKWDCKITVYSRDETKQAEIARRFPEVDCVLGDVLNVERLSLVARGADTIIHTAAIKYIPEAEFNVNECIAINVLGSQAVLSAARIAKAKEVVMISTDKAVEPINTYGATKMLMERMVGEMAAYAVDERIVAVRYGNVVGSTGSIVPVFQRSLREKGEICLTDPSMTRFWISIDDAIDLIERSLEPDVQNGSIVIPRPRSSTISAIANAVVQNEGLTSAVIQVVGKRPGEKMHEALISESERRRTYTLDSQYYNLLPPGNESDVSKDLPPSLSSETAEFIGVQELTEMIRDAASV